MTVQIKLTRGFVATIDDVDADLSKHKWCTKCGALPYARRGIETKGKWHGEDLHRVIASRILARPLVKGEWVDHINGDTLDNRRINLRVVTSSQSATNRIHPNKTTGYRGVTKSGNGFVAAITVNKKRMHLGYFPTAESAHEAYMKAALTYVPDFLPNRKDTP